MLAQAYRHLILTLPERLRTLIYQHAGALLSGLMQAAHRTMDAVVAQTKRQTIRLGYIVVLQTAGREGQLQSAPAHHHDGRGTRGGWDVAAAGLCAV